MHPVDGSEIGARLLSHIASAFDCPDVAFASLPERLQGGYDAAIYGFALDPAPPVLSGPLVLRLGRPHTDPARFRLETAVQNALADMGYPTPRVIETIADPGVLGGPTMMMVRLAGRPLAHGAEGLGGANSLAQKVRMLAELPRLMRAVTVAWVDVQIRLHELPTAPLLGALADAGIDSSVITFEGQLEQLHAAVDRAKLDGLRPGLAWLAANRPPERRAPVICHGDFHPLNIMALDGRITGVIDWANVVIAPPEMDVGSALANIATAPLDMPALLRLPARLLIKAALRRYEAAYRQRRALDDAAVRYYQVYRSFAQLVQVGRNRAAGRSGSGAFQSPAGIASLARYLRKLCGVSLRL